MKALIIKQPGELVLEDIPVPEPGPDEVLIKVAACGICMSDLEAIDGIRPEPYIKYPVVLGHEFSGTVAKVGKDVASFTPGDRVTVKPGYNCGLCKYCLRGEENFCAADRKEHIEIGFTRNGGFAEYTVAKQNQIFRVPDAVSFEIASLTEPGACVWTGVEGSNPKPGDTVAVIGPGPIGLLAVNFYKTSGVKRIIVVGTRDERNRIALEVGATEAINSRKENPFEKLKELTKAEGPDIIFESAGKVEAVKLALDAVRIGGTVALAGVAGIGKKIELGCDYFIFRGVRIIGVLGYTSRGFNKSLMILERNKDKLAKIITHSYPLDQYKRGFETVRTRREGVMKVILKPHIYDR